jgi:hypothetical protein
MQPGANSTVARLSWTADAVVTTAESCHFPSDSCDDADLTPFSRYTSDAYRITTPLCRGNRSSCRIETLGRGPQAETLGQRDPLLETMMPLRGTTHRGNKAALPSKPCAACGLPMSWRRRWAKNWADVKYCSDACRRNKAARG